MNRYFTGFGCKYITFNTDNIAKIDKVFPYLIIGSFILARCNVIPFDIQLNPSFAS